MWWCLFSVAFQLLFLLCDVCFPHNERFFQDHSTFQNRLMARYIDTPARKKLIFPIQNLCTNQRSDFFYFADLFQASQNKTFLRCWLWFMFVNDLKSQKNGMRHQTIMAFFLLYGKSLLATDMKDTECMFLMGKQHFQGSWMVQYLLCLCIEWSATFGVRGTMEPDHESLLCVRDTWWEKATS